MFVSLHPLAAFAPTPAIPQANLGALRQRQGQVAPTGQPGACTEGVDKWIAPGMLHADLAVPGRTIEIEIFGGRFKATVQEDKPLWDADNERLRF